MESLPHGSYVVHEVESLPEGVTRAYWSDLHLSHANIISLCQRPFADVSVMNATLLNTWRSECAELSYATVCAGDLGTRLAELTQSFGPMPHADLSVLLLGNHDTELGTHHGPPRATVTSWFGRVIGELPNWKRHALSLTDTLDGVPVQVLVSHQPLPAPAVPHGTWNVHGHLHDNWDRSPDWHREKFPWVEASTVHLNVSVERVGYRPRTLQWLVDAKREGRLGP